MKMSHPRGEVMKLKHGRLKLWVEKPHCLASKRRLWARMPSRSRAPWTTNPQRSLDWAVM